MNDKDLRLLAYLKDSIGEPPTTGAILLDVKSTQFVRVNLLLLKALSSESGMPGVFVAVDRPHQYMVHLLSMHQMNTQGLVFVDAISRFAADTKTASAKVGFFQGPAHIDKLPQAMKEWSQSGNGHSMDLNKFNFAVIDNLAALLTYNSYSSVEMFLNSFVEVLTTQRNMSIPLVIDRERNCVLYDMARALCDTEIRVNESAMLAPLGEGSRTGGQSIIKDQVR